MAFPSFSFLQTESVFVCAPIPYTKKTGPYIPLVCCGSLPDSDAISSKVAVGVTNSETSYLFPALHGALCP